MLTKLAFQNVKANKGYFIAYILTITFFFVIIYQIGNINYQLGNYLNENGFHGISSNDMFKILKIIIYAIVLLFSAYIANFFIKRRSNEVALLKTLGLNRFSIFKMIVIENIFIILGGFILSIILSIPTSGLFITMSEKLIGYSLDKSQIFASLTSCLGDVALLALVILIIISIIPLFTVLRTNILQLFQEKKKSYELKKKPYFSLLLFVILALILGYMSFFVVTNPDNLNLPVLVLFFGCAVLVAVFLYRGLFSFLFIAYKKKSGIKGSVKLLSFSHLAYRIPSLSKMMSLITVITAILVVLCVSVFGVFNSMLGDSEGNGTRMNVAAISYDKNNFTSLDNQYKKMNDVGYGTFPLYIAADSENVIRKDSNPKQSDFVDTTVQGVTLIKYSDFVALTKLLNSSEQEYDYTSHQQIFNSNAELRCSMTKLCNFLTQNNLSLADFENNNRNLKLDDAFFYPKNPTKEQQLNFEKTKGLIGTAVVVLDDDNKLFNEYKPLYYNISNIGFSKDNFTNLLAVNQLVGDQTDKGIYSLTSDTTTYFLMYFLLIGLFQTVLLLGLLTISIALIMSIFFRTLENLENSLDEYIIAEQIGMSKKKILASLFIEASLTQALPFVVGAGVSILLFKQMFSGFGEALSFGKVITEPLTLWSLGSLAVLLSALIIVLVVSIYRRIKFSNLRKAE